MRGASAMTMRSLAALCVFATASLAHAGDAKKKKGAASGGAAVSR